MLPLQLCFLRVLNSAICNSYLLKIELQRQRWILRKDRILLYTNILTSFSSTHKITAPNKLNLYYLHKQGASQLFLGYCHVIEGECLCIGKAMSFVYSWLKPSVSHYHYMYCVLHDAEKLNLNLLFYLFCFLECMNCIIFSHCMTKYYHKINLFHLHFSIENREVLYQNACFCSRDQLAGYIQYIYVCTMLH